MDNITWIILCFIVLLFALFLAVTYKYFKEQIKSKDSYIMSLQKSLTDLEARLQHKEQRTFRLQLPDSHCRFEIIEVGDKVLEQLRYKKGEGKIKDMSRTGMKLKLDYDLPVRKQIILRLHFFLEGEALALKGKMIRKEERLDAIIYGIRFIETSVQDEQRLARLLHKIEVDRKRKHF